MQNKTLAYYRSLPYRRRAEPRTDEDGRTYFLAWIEEIPWIEIHGETREEALGLLREIFDDCVASMLDAGDEVPEPALWPAGLEEVPVTLAAQPQTPAAEFDFAAFAPNPVAPWTVMDENDAALTAGAAA